jgi:NTE family protein
MSQLLVELVQFFRPTLWSIGFRVTRLGVMLGLTLCAALTQASEPRLRIGLALGGGGARGAAHIGVLEVLEDLRVPVDCVAGTSMGALVAGAYAAGLNPAEMRSEMAQANWVDMFQDNPDYSELNYRSKELAKRFVPGLETGITSSGAQYQTGVVFGQKIKLFFNRLVRAQTGEPRIEQLPLPLSLIATDIGTGERVVFKDGSLTQAMRASMSVPGLMAPVTHQGRKLVDGGLVDNVPIGEARTRCNADVVIAVNVGSPLIKSQDINSLLSVSAQMVNILTEQNVNQSLASLQPQDIYIKPDLKDIGAGDFQRNGVAADLGRLAAQAMQEPLSRLALSPQAYAAWKKTLLRSQLPPQRVDEIQISTLKHVNPAVVSRHVGLKSDGTIDVDALDKGLLRAYGDGFYENVDYALLSSQDRHILRVTPVEKSWGPDYLRMGVNLDTNFNQDSSYALRLAYHKTWLNQLGGELVGGAELGRRSLARIELYQPLQVDQQYFADAGVGRVNELKTIYQDDARLAVYKESQTFATLGVGMNVGLLGQIHLQWRETLEEMSLDTGLPWFPKFEPKRTGGLQAVLDFDQQDRLFWPTKGWATHLNYFQASNADYARLDAEVKAAYKLNAVVLAGKLSYQGAVTGRLPYDNAGSLGGFLNMAGYARGQLVGDDIRFAQVRAEKILGTAPLGLRGDMRLGLALETAKVGYPYTETKRTGPLNSTTLYLGGETPLGAVYLGIGRAGDGAANFYLFLGTP